MAASSPEQHESFEVRTVQQEALRLQEMNRGRKLVKSLLTETIVRPVGPTLLDLPLEILTHILLRLPFTSVVICQGVNRHLYGLIFESTELQYHIHLGISGLVDNPHCDLSIAERLSLLLARERRWEGLDFDFHKVVDVIFPFKSSTATLSARIFGGVAVGGCRYMQIPSAATEEVKWREIRTEQTIVMEVPGFHEPDLHVLITTQPRTVYTNVAGPRTVHDVRVHLNQLSTGKPHPNVRRTTISFEAHELFEEPRVFMRCAGDNMVLVLRDRRGRSMSFDQVLVYEWRTGELKLTFSAPWRSYRYPLFLTTHLFLLPNVKTGELEYWQIPKSPSEPTPSQPFFLLSLPRLRSGNTFQSITPFAEPNIGPYNGSKPFHTNPRDAIAFFYVDIWWGRLNHFRLFIHRSSLIGCLDQFSAYTSLSDRPEPVPYDKWGPPVCRWLDDDQGPWLETTFGQRYVTPPPGSGVREAPLTVLDFNPIGVVKVLAAEKRLKAGVPNEGSRDTAQPEKGEHIWQLPVDNAENGPALEGRENQLPRESRSLAKVVVRPMSPLSDPDDCFENTVYSSLPYTVRSSLEKYSFDGLIPDEESILGVREDYDRQIREIQIFHYG
ncbi:hypothetical protein P691DRAFT_800386 [Macrolepiota fuliginosa MF-IS2]|uniref:F-box domain-containing protein n=1 Tax=Macrolepiota fuliginosa MF-IS2 TaxID=1400762 RepID=A0A9P5XEI9_9AGAR|nr:hypothetical protein P691DRAFT_800386 [Macrolepiota fuliginosa MF-IS2]